MIDEELDKQNPAPDLSNGDPNYYKKLHYDNDVKRFKEYWTNASWQTLCNFRDYCFFRGSTECTHPTFFIHFEEQENSLQSPVECYLGQEFYNIFETEYMRRLAFMRNDIDQLIMIEIRPLIEQAEDQHLEEDVLKEKVKAVYEKYGKEYKDAD